MGYLLTLPVRWLFAWLRRLSVQGAVSFGRTCGAVSWWLLRRHRRVALENLTAVFGSELAPAAVRQLARENFLRLGENYVGALWTAGRTAAEIREVVELTGEENLPPASGPRTNLVFAMGHFGNFELCGRAAAAFPHLRSAATYRAFRPRAFNDLALEFRHRSQVRYFERTSQARELRRFMAEGNAALGLLGDQHGGPKGLWLPFMGRPCSVSPAVAIFAQRYRAVILPIICFRVAPGRWRLEIGQRIEAFLPDGTARAATAVMRDVNQIYEAAIRRDPANWFWVHRRWKAPSESQRTAIPEDSALNETVLTDPS